MDHALGRLDRVLEGRGHDAVSAGVLTRLELAFEELRHPLLGYMDVFCGDDLGGLASRAEAPDLLDNVHHVMLVEVRGDGPHALPVAALVRIVVPGVRHVEAEVRDAGVEDRPLPGERQLGEIRHLHDRAIRLLENHLLASDDLLEEANGSRRLARQEEELDVSEGQGPYQVVRGVPVQVAFATEAIVDGLGQFAALSYGHFGNRGQIKVEK